jgi:hypothetical protein
VLPPPPRCEFRPTGLPGPVGWRTSARRAFPSQVIRLPVGGHLNNSEYVQNRGGLIAVLKIRTGAAPPDAHFDSRAMCGSESEQRRNENPAEPHGHTYTQSSR